MILNMSGNVFKIDLTPDNAEIPLDLLPIMDKDGYIWIGGE